MSDSRISFDTWRHLYSDRVQEMQKTAQRDLFAGVERPGVIGLSGGLPDISSLPLDEVARCAQKTIEEEGLLSLQYGDPSGREKMRSVVCDILHEQHIETDIDHVFLVTGSQQALDFLGRIFINPGDTIICEGPTYLGAMQAFMPYHPNIVCIEMDDEGMRTDILEKTLRELGDGGAKFIYTIPTFQNPTGTTMSYERRVELLELAHRYHIPVVEDDPYSQLRYEGEDILPLKAMDEQVIYLGTASKIFAPGLRMAWCCAPKHFLDKMNLCLQGASLCVSPFDTIMAEHYFSDTDWHATLDKTVEKYHVRRNALLNALEHEFPEEATWTHPEGGFFIWISLPEYFDTKQMLSAAVDNGVAYVPGQSCFPDGRGKNSMRLSFSFEDEKNLQEGVCRLSQVIDERMRLYRSLLNAGAL